MNFIKYIKFILTGLIFGVILAKSEVASWYRIQEMFRFQSFHMYGVIGVAVVLGVITVWAIKKHKAKDYKGNKIVLNPKQMSIPRYLIGGVIFGLGWALSGACPGPMFTLAGMGYGSLLVVIGGAVAGTFAYGLLRDRLPH